MRRAALHALALFGAATFSIGAWAQTHGIDDVPEDETAPNRDRERHDDPPPPAASADAGSEVDAAASAAPSSSAPPAASSAPEAPPPPPAASAAPPSEPEHEPSELGFSFGIRGSYATPFGAASGGPLNQVMLGLFPVGLDLGWFFSPNLYVGAYGLYGFAVGVEPQSDTCSDPDETCGATFISFGATTEWHFRPHEFYDPWVGVGIAYEIINLTAGNQAAQTQDETNSLHGFDVSLRAGLDFKPKHYYGLGPFIELASGHYARPPVADGVDPGSAFSLHEWLGFGIRLHSGI
jgi:hypothetical protein